MDDDQLKTAVDEILSRKKSPIELAHDAYMLAFEGLIETKALHEAHYTNARSRAEMKESEDAHDEAKAALAQAIWDGWSAISELGGADHKVLLDLKSLAMNLMPRSKIEEALKARKL